MPKLSKFFGGYEGEIHDPTGLMGVHLLHKAEGEFVKIHSRKPVTLFPLGASIARLPDKKILDETRILFLPANFRLEFHAISQRFSVAVFYFSDELIKKSSRLFKLNSGAVGDKFKVMGDFFRTTWTNEIGHRYLFERVNAREKNTLVTNFLECEWVKEIYYLHVNNGRVLDNRNKYQIHDARVSQVAHFIEANLFSNLTTDDLLKVWKTSPSTLYRAFQKEFGISPFDYVVSRKLEEAELLLRTRRYSIGEVAFRVGYSNVAAFSTAFRKKFGISPSEVEV